MTLEYLDTPAATETYRSIGYFNLEKSPSEYFDGVTLSQVQIFLYFYIFFYICSRFLSTFNKTELYDIIMSRLSRLIFSHWTSLCYNIETYTTPTVEIDLTVVIEKS